MCRTSLGSVLLVLLLIGSTGCKNDSHANPGLPPVEPMPEEQKTLYDQMFDVVDAFPVEDGNWPDDYGDAPFYGIGLYARLGIEREDEALLAKAEAARDYNLSVVEQSNEDSDWYLANVEEVLMAQLGLIEYVAATGDDAPLAPVEQLMETTNDMVGMLGNYLPSSDDGLGSFALGTYGATAITAGLALLDLQYVKYIDSDKAAGFLANAKAIAAAIDREAFDGERYLIEPDNEEWEIYPNLMMILVLSRLYEATDDQDYLDQAELVGHSIAELRDPNHDGYHSPYSADVMGATTDDYSTLSSQNYVTMAFGLLYANTHDPYYFDEAMATFEFVRTHMHDEETDRLLHHWMDGRIAIETDASYFCSGCNLQFVYILWYWQRVIGVI